MRTYSEKKEGVERRWVLLDAEDQVLGRLATNVADILRGKNKTTYTPHLDMGDFVVIVNAEKIRLTGNKLKKKVYYRHSGFPGGLKSETALERQKKYPERIILDAVSGMLPKNKLRKQIIKKLKVYPGGEHPHVAQNPEKLN
ncbi:MAG: 50S ribosomal protein L13 [Nitrospinota bacterium]